MDFAMSVSVLAYRNHVVAVMLVENVNIVNNDIKDNNHLTSGINFLYFYTPEIMLQDFLR